MPGDNSGIGGKVRFRKPLDDIRIHDVLCPALGPLEVLPHPILFRSPYHVILTFLHRKLAECTRSCEKRCYCWRYVAKSFRWNMAVSRVLILYYSVRARADVKLDYPGMFYYFHTGRFCSGYGRCRRDVRGC
jgi:hypothetical protein